MMNLAKISLFFGTTFNLACFESDTDLMAIVLSMHAKFIDNISGYVPCIECSNENTLELDEEIKII